MIIGLDDSVEVDVVGDVAVAGYRSGCHYLFVVPCGFGGAIVERAESTKT